MHQRHRKSAVSEIEHITAVYEHHKQEGHDGPVSRHWLMRKIPSSQHYNTLELV